MNLRQAAQMALEALVQWEDEAPHAWSKADEDAVAALRAALAEPEPGMHQYKYQAYGYYKEDGKLKLGTIPEPQTTHWEGCEAVHPECRKPEQEPVAHKHEWFSTGAMKPGQMRCIHCGVWNHEAAPTPYKPLTDEQIDRVTDQQWAGNNHKPIYAAHRAYARAIERAHGIGDSNEP